MAFSLKVSEKNMISNFLYYNVVSDVVKI